MIREYWEKYKDVILYLVFGFASMYRGSRGILTQ